MAAVKEQVGEGNVVPLAALVALVVVAITAYFCSRKADKAVELVTAVANQAFLLRAL
eukprot:SAG31_NODE_18380_length_638_cov_1.241187_1_plen_56_part_01